MAATLRQTSNQPLIDLLALSQDLARLDPRQSDGLAYKVVTIIARHLHTDRVSLIIHNSAGSVQRVASYGFELKTSWLTKPGKVIKTVLKSLKPLCIYNIHEHPDLIADRIKEYRSDAFMICPIVEPKRGLALLCISNLATQQLTQLDNTPDTLSLILTQISQLCCLSENIADPEVTFRADELSLLGSLMERLEQGLEPKNIFEVFVEEISGHLPIDLLAVVHDQLVEDQQGVICANRPMHIEDIEQVFSDLSHQWQRRNQHSPLLKLKDAVMCGSELVSEEGTCPDELRLGRTLTLPVFIDNDLFAVVAVAMPEDVLIEQRRLHLLTVLINHLMLHVKKGMLIAQNEEMQTLDALTGLYNERHFYRMMQREFDRAARYNVPLCMLVVDVDHFKDVNETYGFETGDLLLKEISSILMENIRTTDFISRYSGKQFVLLLPETHAKNAEIMANRLRRFIENNSFYIPNTNVYVKVTVSMGVASYLDHKPTNLAQFIEFADTALYFAKRNGRNRVVGYSMVIEMMMHETDNEG